MFGKFPKGRISRSRRSDVKNKRLVASITFRKYFNVRYRPLRVFEESYAHIWWKTRFM